MVCLDVQVHHKSIIETSHQALTLVSSHLNLCLFDSLWSYMLLFLQMILSDISSCAQPKTKLGFSAESQVTIVYRGKQETIKPEKTQQQWNPSIVLSQGIPRTYHPTPHHYGTVLVSSENPTFCSRWAPSVHFGKLSTQLVLTFTTTLYVDSRH